MNREFAQLVTNRLPVNVLLVDVTAALLPNSVNTRSLNELLSWMLLLLPAKISSELLAPLPLMHTAELLENRLLAISLSLLTMLTPHAPRSLLVPNDSMTLLPVITFEMTRVAREVSPRCFFVNDTEAT